MKKWYPLIIVIPLIVIFFIIIFRFFVSVGVDYVDTTGFWCTGEDQGPATFNITLESEVSSPLTVEIELLEILTRKKNPDDTYIEPWEWIEAADWQSKYDLVTEEFTIPENTITHDFQFKIVSDEMEKNKALIKLKYQVNILSPVEEYKTMIDVKPCIELIPK